MKFYQKSILFSTVLFTLFYTLGGPLIAMCPREKSANTILEITIMKGETVEIKQGYMITFESHSHKRTLIGGPESPLIIYMSYRFGEKIDLMLQHNTYPTTGSEWGWSWKNFKFVVQEYKYDTFMKLKIIEEKP